MNVNSTSESKGGELYIDDIRVGTLPISQFPLKSGLHQIKKIIICTDRAESRAPAIAAAITRYIGESDISFWRNYKYHPNVNVFNRLCKSFNVYMPKIAISYRVFINKYALRKQINKSRK